MSLTKRKLGRTAFEVSPLGLGTVEIGLPYGIGKTDVPDEAIAERVLKTAIDSGINFIDTGFSYGLAEERIGKFGISKIPGVVVATKCAKILEEGGDPRGDELEKLIREQIEESLRRLKVETIQLIQLHGGSKEQIERGELIDVMQKLKDEGKVQHVGISVRGTESPLAAIASDFFDTIQVAHSILDQRMAAEVLPKALNNNVAIINRSVFLKGSLTPAREKLPEQLSVLKGNADKAAIIAEKLGVSLPCLALRFVISNPAITVALVGASKPERIQDAVEAYEMGPLTEEVLEELRSLAVQDVTQIDPAKWPKV